MQFFAVEPAAVRQLSLAFGSAAWALGSDAVAFGAAARVPGAAFGQLPQGVSANSQYALKLDEALRGLAALQATLEQVAANLASSADTYLAAEQANGFG